MEIHEIREWKMSFYNLSGGAVLGTTEYKM